VVLEDRRRARERADSAGERAQVPAGGRKPEIASMPESFCSARGVDPTQILAGLLHIALSQSGEDLRQGDMKKSGFVARPRRSPIAEAQLQIGEVGASVRTSI